MNLKETPRESLFSGGEDGNGIIYVSVHDATMDRSTRIKHVVNIYRFIREKSEIATLGLISGGLRPTTYFILV